MKIFPWEQTRMKATWIHFKSKFIALEYSVLIRRYLHFTKVSQSRLPFCVRSRPHVFCQYNENDVSINPIIYTKQRTNKMLSNRKKRNSEKIFFHFFICTKSVRTYVRDPWKCPYIHTQFNNTKKKTRKNAIVEYLDYQIPVTQLNGDMQAPKRD